MSTPPTARRFHSKPLAGTAEYLRDPLPAEAGSRADVHEGLAARAGERDRDAQLLARLDGVRCRSLDAA